MTLEPTTQAFIDSLSGPPLSQLKPAAAHQVLTDLQSQPVPLQDARIEDTSARRGRLAFASSALPLHAPPRSCR
jgi:hypothetical protein